MAIIYTYPVKTNPAGDDLILISDSADENKTKQVKVSTLPSLGGGSVSSVGFSLNNLAAFTVTGDNPITGSGTITLGVTGGSSGQYLDYQGNWTTPAGGDTYTLQAEAKSSNSIPLKLDAAIGTDSTVSLTEGTNVTLTRNSATEITIAATGGNAGVSSFTNANGTYISAGTANSAATGAVTMGTIDLSAVNGTSDTTTRFLSKDNTWDVPSYTTTYSLPLANSSTRGGVKIVSTRDASPLQAPTTTASRDYQVQMNTNATYSEQLFVNVPWADTTYDIMGSGNSYAAGLVLAGNATHNNTFLRKDGTWQTVSASPDGNNTEIQYNNSGSFGATDLFTYSSRTLSVGKVGDTARSHLKVYGGGNDDAHLTLYCSAGTHGVTIEGPDHTGGSNYTLKLPKVITTQTAYSSGGRILESNSSGALQWINTPTGGGVTQTSGVWYATLANSSGQSYASNATQAQITITTNNCQWLRIGNMIHYQFYLAGTLKGTGSGAAGTLQGPLFLCQTGTGGGLSATTYGLPINTTLGNTLVDDGFCNGSLVMTETEAPQQALTWAYPVNGGRIGRDTNYVGYVELCSLLPATNKLYYPNSAVVWITNNNETAGNWALAGTLSAMVSHA